jgi:hypothetical protein
MSVKDRMSEFLKHLDASQGKFEKFVGLSNGFVNNIGVGISSTSINKISKKYPELNTTWLLTGEGSMLKEAAPYQPTVTIAAEDAEPYTPIESKTTTNSTLQAQALESALLKIAAAIQELAFAVRGNEKILQGEQQEDVGSIGSSGLGRILAGNKNIGHTSDKGGIKKA